MIITVTMNPAVDKTVWVEDFVPGGLNRISRAQKDPGGKGINVSKTLRALGGSSAAVGFLAGGSGRYIEEELRKQGIACDFVYVDGETRTNTKILDQNGTMTELNEPGPRIGREAVEELTQKLLGYAGPQTLFVLSGSVPAGVDAGIYAQIIRSVHQKGARVLLDADGELLARAIEEKPDMIKPNREELERYMARRAAGDALRALAEGGIPRIALSLGAEGALFMFDGICTRCPALPVSVRSALGAGDAMAAALALAWERGLSREETIRLCMATSAAAVTTEGSRPPAREAAEALLSEVHMEVRD